LVIILAVPSISGKKGSSFLYEVTRPLGKLISPSTTAFAERKEMNSEVV